jgi:1-acyl-sn-glycerol-3-phosphate acyltransferase
MSTLSLPTPVSAPDPLEKRSTWFVGLFSWYARRFVARHFHAVRLARAGAAPGTFSGPLVVALNHPSWWDPMVAAVLAERFPAHRIAAPIEAKALARYRFFHWLGFFGVEAGSSRGYEQLLGGARRVLARPDGALWLTPQGHFVDSAVRPVELRPGIGHVLHDLSNATLLPVAIDYRFWDERLPEALVRFGDPIRVLDGRALSPSGWTALCAQALEDTQDALAVDAARRDPSRFETILSGRAGVNPVYDLFQRVKAWLSGDRWDPEHASVVGRSAK